MTTEEYRKIMGALAQATRTQRKVDRTLRFAKVADAIVRGCVLAALIGVILGVLPIR